MSELPKGWAGCRLDEISAIITGKTPSKKNAEYFGGSIPFIKPGDVNNQGFIEFTQETLTELGAKTVPIIPKNSITVTCIGNLGRVGITTKESVTNQQINTVVVNPLINYRFIYHYIRTLKHWMESEASATTVSIINKSKFSAAPVYLAPLNEQVRIADKLDLILAKVNKAQARLDKIPVILKRFRQSVLVAATSGELTKEWRESQNLAWLVKSYTVSEIAKKSKYSLSIGPFGSNLKVADYKEDGNPLVFVSEIRGRNFGSEKTKYIDNNKFNELVAHRVKPGNILITKMGDPPGDVAIYPEHLPEGVITADCIRLDVNEELFDAKLIFYFLQSEPFQAQIKSITAGVAQQKVNLKNFKVLTIDLPSL